MKTLTFATIALCCAGAAAAAPADDMVGTWECRQAGVNYRNKPPILYVDAGSAGAPDKAAFALEVDGFVREVYGNSDVTADADGWWKISPSKGEAFMVRPQGATAKSRTASMELRRAGTSYRCLRLPPSAAPGAAPSPAQSLLPTEEKAAPPAEAPAAAPGETSPASKAY